MMAENDLASRLLAAITSSNAGLREFYVRAAGLGTAKMPEAFQRVYASFADLVTDTRYDAAMMDVMANYGRERLSARCGLEIDEISEAGLARAIGRRAGFDLSSLSDVDKVRGDLIKAAAERVAARMGWTLQRAVRSGDDLLNELQQRAANMIESKVPGLVLHDVMNMSQVVEDCQRWAAKKITERTGIPLRDISDPAKTKHDLLNWAEDECRRRLKIDGSGGGVKMTKKAIRNRLAQRRFYEAHGDRHVFT